MLHEGAQRFVRQRRRGVGLKHAANVGQQHEQILGRQIGEADYRSRQIDQSVPRKGVFGQSRLQRLVAVQAAPRIHQKLRRAAHQQAETGGAALQHVIQDVQDLLVVAISGLTVHQLVEVDQLVQHHEQAPVTGLPDERREQLQMIVDAGVVDDRAHLESGAGVGAGGVFCAQPTHRVCLQRFIVLLVALPVAADDGRKLVAAGQLFKMSEPGANHPVGRQPPFFGLLHGAGDEPFHHAGQRAARRPRTGRGAAGKLREQRPGLAAGGVQPPVGREVGGHDDQALFQRDEPDQVEKEGLARTVLADHEAQRGAAGADPVDLLDHFVNFADPSDLDVLQSQFRNDAGPQRLDYGISFPRLQLWPRHRAPPNVMRRCRPRDRDSPRSSRFLRSTRCRSVRMPTH